VADLAASLAEGAAAHAADVRRRLPGAALVVQFDEPALPGVIAGSVPSASGLRRVAPVDAAAAADRMREVLAAASAPAIVHCCAPDVPWRLIASSGASAVSFDLALVRRADEDAIGEIAEAGFGIAVGAVPALADPVPEAAGREVAGERPAGAAQTAREVISLWQRIGLPLAGLTDQVIVTPACGLAGASPDRARAVLARCQEAARVIPEMIEEGVR
jgi:hypothetical protein